MGEELFVCVEIGLGDCDESKVDFAQFSETRDKLSAIAKVKKVFKVSAPPLCAYYVVIITDADAIPQIADIVGDDKMENAFIGNRSQYKEFMKTVETHTTVTTDERMCIVM